MNVGPEIWKELLVLGEAGYKKLAQKGYEAYARHAGWKDAQDEKLPQWDDLPEKAAQAWLAATNAITAEWHQLKQRGG
jgi:hypothetical protein